MQPIGDWLLTGLNDCNRFTKAAEDLSNRDGFLQRLDPRFKSASGAALIVASVFSRSPIAILIVLALALIAAGRSGVSFRAIVLWIWIPVLTFTGLLALPAIFTTPGDPIATLPVLGWSIQSQGVKAAVTLLLRSGTATTISALVALTTSWPILLKALRALHLPVVFVVMLGTTHRYLFLLLQTASEMSESRRSRSVGPLSAKERRRIANASIGVLLSKSFQLSGDVHIAMLSRGFRGEVFVLDEFQAKASDWLWLGLSLSLALLLAIYSR